MNRLDVDFFKGGLTEGRARKWERSVLTFLLQSAASDAKPDD